MTFSCFCSQKKHLQSDLSQFPFPLRTHLGSLALTRLEYQTRHGCKRTKKSDVLKVLEENTWIIIESFTILHSSQNVEILQEQSLCLVATCPWCSANHQDTLMIQVSIDSKYTHTEHAKTGETTCTFQIQHTLETTNHTSKHFSFHRNIAILSPHKFNFKMASVSFIPKRKHGCMVGQHHRTTTLHHSTPCPLLWDHVGSPVIAPHLVS